MNNEALEQVCAAVHTEWGYKENTTSKQRPSLLFNQVNTSSKIKMASWLSKVHSYISARLHVC